MFDRMSLDIFFDKGMEKTRHPTGSKLSRGHTKIKKTLYIHALLDVNMQRIEYIIL